MEKFPWKLVYWGAIFSLAVLGFAYYLTSLREAPYVGGEKSEKMAEFKNTRIEGRKEGKKVWELFAQEGWTTKDLQATYLYHISSGKIYRNNQLVVMGLSAPYAKVLRDTENIEAFKQGKERLQAFVDLGKFSANPKKINEWIKLRADYLKYLPAEKKAEISGNVVLTQKEQVIFAEKININLEQKIAEVLEKVHLKRKDGWLRCDFLRYFGEKEWAEAWNQVYLNLKENNVVTEIKGQRAELYRDPEKDIELSGSLEVIQGKKMAIAPQGRYSKGKKEILLWGGVKVILEKGKALFREETLKKLRNPEVKELVKDKTLVSAQQISFSIANSNAQVQGSVEVSQKGKEAKAEEALYDDLNETLALSGNVLLKKGEVWVKCKRVLVSIPKETFEAEEVEEAKLKL